MKWHRLSALLIVTALVGFAPAPFPRPQRVAKVDDMERLQGIWAMTHQESGGTVTSHNYKVRIKGNDWTFIQLNNNQENDSAHYFLRLDQTVSPRAMEWGNDKDGTSGWIASYRIEGKRLTVIYDSGTLKNNLHTRPKDFEGTPPHKMVFEFIGR